MSKCIFSTRKHSHNYLALFKKKVYRLFLDIVEGSTSSVICIHLMQTGTYHPSTLCIVQTFEYNDTMMFLVCTFKVYLYKFFGHKEVFEVVHLPETNNTENDNLSNSPPDNTRVSKFRLITEVLFTFL